MKPKNRIKRSSNVRKLEMTSSLEARNLFQRTKLIYTVPEELFNISLTNPTGSTA